MTKVKASNNKSLIKSLDKLNAQKGKMTKKVLMEKADIKLNNWLSRKALK